MPLEIGSYNLFEANCAGMGRSIGHEFLKYRSQFINEAIDETQMLRFVAPLIALGTGLSILAMRIVAVFECFSKAVIHLFGGIGSQDFNVLLGVRQLFIELPYAVVGLGLSPVEVAFNVAVLTLGILVLPDHTLRINYLIHEYFEGWCQSFLLMGRG